MKRVFITGGSRGIGRATVKAFLDARWKVGFCYHNSKDAAEELVREGNGDCFAFRCDLSVLSEVDALSDCILREFGLPDVLVNNAGLAEYGLFQDLSPERFDEICQVDLKAPFFLSARLAPGMIRRRSGRIINVSSVWGEAGASCEVAYSAFKAALNGFTKALAKELAPSGIAVNAVAPGVVDTDMMSRFSEQEKNTLCEGIPTGRFTTADEVARTILFLADAAPADLTGQIIGINGGMI